MNKYRKTKYWACPKMTCDNFLLFAEAPYMPCAKHGEMIRDNEISLQKRSYNWFKVKIGKII